MSIVHINTDLRENHSIGDGTRERLVSPALCPALASHGIGLVGLSDAGPAFRFVRLQPRWGQLLVCTAGAGWVWLDRAWVRCDTGTAYVSPPGVLHAYHSDPAERWRIGWVQSSEPWLCSVNQPVLLSGDPGPLVGAISGLHWEAMGAHDPALLLPWASLVASYARRFVLPAGGDPCLRRLWEAVSADLARPWDVAALAAGSGFRGEHLRRLCLRELGHSPMRHVTFLRMRQAGALLSSEAYTVEAVAQQVGYDNPFSFSTAFKRETGLSPSQYRRKALAG